MLWYLFYVSIHGVGVMIGVMPSKAILIGVQQIFFAAGVFDKNIFSK